jgi:hypothetical protein
MPRHHLVIWSPLRAIGQRLIMPNWLAITIGPLIFAWRVLDEPELAHELAHVRQWRQHGLLYPWRYWRASEAAAAAGLDRYRDNAFEVEARAAADAVR